MISQAVILMNWLEEEREKLQNLTVTQQSFGVTGNHEMDFQFVEALSLPIEVHTQRVQTLERLLEEELAK